MKKNLSPTGFSLIEVIVAFGVVSTGLLTLMAVFVTGTRSNQHGEDLSKAVYYARKITEVVRANGLGNPVPDPADDKFQRNVMIRPESNSSSDFRYNLLNMDVTVRWQGGKSGDGMRRVKITSLLKSGS